MMNPVLQFLIACLVVGFIIVLTIEHIIRPLYRRLRRRRLRRAKRIRDDSVTWPTFDEVAKMRKDYDAATPKHAQCRRQFKLICKPPPSLTTLQKRMMNIILHKYSGNITTKVLAEELTRHGAHDLCVDGTAARELTDLQSRGLVQVSPHKDDEEEDCGNGYE